MAIPHRIKEYLRSIAEKVLGQRLSKSEGIKIDEEIEKEQKEKVSYVYTADIRFISSPGKSKKPRIIDGRVTIYSNRPFTYDEIYSECAGNLRNWIVEEKEINPNFFYGGDLTIADIEENIMEGEIDEKVEYDFWFVQ